MNVKIKPANTSEYQHHLCEIIIRFLYGDDADVEQYKVYHGTGRDHGRLRGVDIAQFDYTTYQHTRLHQVKFDDKVAEAMKHAKFGDKYGDLFMHDEGGSLFKAVIDSQAYKHLGYKQSVLCIYPK